MDARFCGSPEDNRPNPRVLYASYPGDVQTTRVVVAFFAG